MKNEIVSVRKDFSEELGKVYGKRTVIKILGRQKYGDGHLLVLSKCECGKEDIVRLDELKKGKRLMCVNCGYEHQGEKEKSDREALYDIWRGMKKRCYNKNVKGYRWYGAKGIKVCEEWRSNFDSFYSWCMSHGYKKGLSIDRIDGNKDYEPDNCRMATMKEQIINRGIQKNNKTGYIGVGYNKNGKKYNAQIKIDRKNIQLGVYNTKKEALEARNKYITDNGLDKIGYKIQEYKGE